jgi:hypothetical protein
MKRENRKMLKNLLTNFSSATQKSKNICDISTDHDIYLKCLTDNLCLTFKFLNLFQKKQKAKIQAEPAVTTRNDRRKAMATPAVFETPDSESNSPVV